jgi:NitT/TauT family transport system ATP-binding protein
MNDTVPERTDMDTGSKAQGSPVLSVQDVSMTFRTGKTELTAVKNVSLDVREGEFLSLVGRSGCGKSTLLRIVSGLIAPTSGRVECLGREVTGPLDDFGIVFQSPVLLPWRSAVSNVLLPIEMLGRDTRAYRDRAHELIEMVGLKGFADRRPHELSGGMRQRVAICRSLIHDPAFLLMDEPFSAVDEITREELNNVLLDVWRTSGKTILFVTHSIQEAVLLSDRVATFLARPGRLNEIFEIPVPRPRDTNSRFQPEMAEIADRIRVSIGEARVAS